MADNGHGYNVILWNVSTEFKAFEIAGISQLILTLYFKYANICEPVCQSVGITVVAHHQD